MTFEQKKTGELQMIDKIMSLDEALGDLFDGAVILVGGFGQAGAPHNLLEAASNRDLRNITLVCNGTIQTICWSDPKGVSKYISSWPVPPYSAWKRSPVAEAIVDGKIDVQEVPLGTLVERIRAGGAGIPAFYSPVGVGTVFEQGKEKRVIDGKEYMLEHAIKGDIAFIKADKADRLGNLVYRMTQKNHNPVMASAAKVTVAEVDEIVAVGELGPHEIATPGIFVNRVVQIPKRYIGAEYWESKDVKSRMAKT